MLKKNNMFIIFFIGYSFFMHTAIKGMEEENRIADIYFHGFGEVGDLRRGPVFPDGPLQLDKARFFTRYNVLLAAQYLKKKVVNKKYNVVHLEAKSMGAGILINCLYKLVHYEKDFFKSTDISQQDATDILAAVNRGKIALSTPALSMQKTCIVAFFSQCASYSTIFFTCGFAAWKKWLFAEWFEINLPDKNVQIVGFFIASMMMISACGRILENMYGNFIDRYIIPLATRGNYNPYFIKPLEAAKQLAPHLTCPVLIHCSRNDEIVINDKEMADLFHAFFYRYKPVKGSFKVYKKKFPTYYLLSDDDTHDRNNDQYNLIRNYFLSKTPKQFSKFSQHPSIDSSVDEKKVKKLSYIFYNKEIWSEEWFPAYEEIKNLQKNPVSEFFNLGYSVFRTFDRF